MTIKEKLIRMIDIIPADRLPQLLDLAETLAASPQTQPEDPDENPDNTIANLVKFLKTPGNTWTGDDIQECVDLVLNTRSPIVFDRRINPFE